MGSKDTSWEELACESPRSGTSSSTKFSIYSWSHSGISEHNGLLRSILGSFWWVFEFWSAYNGSRLSILDSFLIDFGSFRLAWSTTGCSVLSSTLGTDTGTGEVSPSVRSSLSRVSLSLDGVCGWRRRAWGRCRTRPLLSWKCHWGWRMRTGGRTRWQAWNHDRNEILRIANYPNPVLNEMWFFWQSISIHENIRFHRKALRIYTILWHTL